MIYKFLTFFFFFQCCHSIIILFDLPNHDSPIRTKRQNEADECSQKCIEESKKNMNDTGNNIFVRQRGNNFYHDPDRFHHNFPDRFRHPDRFYHHNRFPRHQVHREYHGRNNAVQVKLTMKEDMKSFCQKVYEPLQRCNSQCPGATSPPTFDDNGNLNNVWIMNFMCDHLEGAKWYTSCKDKMNGTETDCSAKCATIILPTEKSNSTVPVETENEASIEVEETCKQIKCSIDCQVEDAIDKCDRRSAQYLKDMIKAVILENPDFGKMLNLIQQQLDEGDNKNIPFACVRLFESLS